MTVTEKSSRKLITGSGWANPLTHNFELENSTHLKVYADDVELTLGVDYSISGIGVESGYSVTISTPGSWAPVVWVLSVEPPISQADDVSLGGAYGARFEDSLDALTRRVQRLRDDTRRAYKVPRTTVVGEAPTMDVLALDHFWIADSNGNMIDGGDAGDIADAQEYAERAEAAAAAAEAGGNGFTFATKAIAETFSPAAAPTLLRTSFLDTDQVQGSGSLYKNNGGTSGDITITLADGVTNVGFDRSAPEYDAAQFGVKANGSTDDLPAWQSGINYVNTNGGGIIRVPRGINLLDGSLELKSNVTLRGYDRTSQFKLADGASAGLTSDGSALNWIYADGATNVGVEDCYINGNDANNTTISRGLAFLDCDGVHVSRVWVSDTYGTAIALLTTVNFELTSIYLRDLTGNFPGSNPGEGIYFRDSSVGLIQHVRGVNIDDHLIYGDGGATGSSDIVISDAIGYNCGRVSLSSAFNLFQNLSRITLNSCYSYASGMGFTILAAPGGATFPKDIELNNCTSYDSDGVGGEAHGFNINGSNASRANMRIRLNNCKAKSSGGGAVVTGNGFYVVDVDDIEINSCTASDSNDHGFFLVNVTNFVLDGRAINNSRRASGSFDGVRLGDGTAGGACSAGQVNVVSKDTASSGKFQNYGVRARESCSDIEITGKLDGNATGRLLNAGDASVYLTRPTRQARTSFTIRLRNTAGTLEHAFGRSGTAFVANNMMAAINGALITASSTPTGADGSTAFVAGAKISSATTSRIILDTADQTVGEQDFVAVIAAQTAGSQLNVRAIVTSIDVNGVTRTRLCFDFVDGVGNAFPLTTVNVAAGEFIDVTFSGYLAV